MRENDTEMLRRLYIKKKGYLRGDLREEMRVEKRGMAEIAERYWMNR